MRRLFQPLTTAQWVPLCPADELRRHHASRPKRITIHDTTHLAAFWDTERDTAAVVVDRCHHRGASLSVGRVEKGCVRCKYHDHSTKPRRQSTIVKDGLVWYDDTTFGKSPTSPHASWEFDAGQRMYTYVRQFPNCSALYMLENTLDWSHLEHIHAFSFVRGKPAVIIHSDHLASYVYQTSLPDTVLEVENEWWDTWTTCLRFKIGSEPGDMQHQFSLHFAFVPTGTHECAVIVRVCRQCMLWTGFLGDLTLMISNELPLYEDRGIVSTIPHDHSWSDDHLGTEDEFLRRFRASWQHNFPELVAFYARP